MNTFLNQWSTRAISTYAQTSMPARRSATVVVVEDIAKPFERRQRHETAALTMIPGSDNRARHPGGRRAGGVRIGTVADDEYFRRIELPACRGDDETARMRLEPADVRIGGAKHEREAVCNAERLQLAFRRII